MTTGQQEVGVSNFTNFRISNYFNRIWNFQWFLLSERQGRPGCNAYERKFCGSSVGISVYKLSMFSELRKTNQYNKSKNSGWWMVTVTNVWIFWLIESQSMYTCSYTHSCTFQVWEMFSRLFSQPEPLCICYTVIYFYALIYGVHECYEYG